MWTIPCPKCLEPKVFQISDLGYLHRLSERPWGRDPIEAQNSRVINTPHSEPKGNYIQYFSIPALWPQSVTWGPQVEFFTVLWCRHWEQFQDKSIFWTLEFQIPNSVNKLLLCFGPGEADQGCKGSSTHSYLVECWVTVVCFSGTNLTAGQTDRAPLLCRGENNPLLHWQQRIAPPPTTLASFLPPLFLFSSSKRRECWHHPREAWNKYHAKNGPSGSIFSCCLWMWNPQQLGIWRE